MPEADEGLPGVDPDAEPERSSADGLELLGVLGDPKACAHGALGSSSWAAGTPKTPTTASPMNFSTTPP